VDFLAVAGLESRAVFTLSNVNGRAERAMGVVDLDVDAGVRVAMRSVLFTVVLRVDTGTAVSFLFSGDANLFLDDARRARGGSLIRRVLTFPSGFMGEVEFELLVGLGGCGGLVIGLLVGRGEDAERDRDSGFKIQVDDFPDA